MIGKPVQVVKNHLEAGAAGTALTVAVGMGVYENMDEVDQLISISRKVQPEAANWQRYDQLYREYREIYELLIPTHRRLHDIE